MITRQKQEDEDGKAEIHLMIANEGLDGVKEKGS